MFNVRDWLNNKNPTSPPSGGTGGAPPQNGFQPQTKSAQPPKEQPAELSAPVQKPFMAEAVDAMGNPYYGTGFKGWARGTFARILDPKNFVSNIKDAEFQKAATEDADEYEEGINKLSRWDEWGGKWLGISAEDIGQSLAAMQAEKHEGEAKGEAFGTGVSAVSGMFGRSVKEMGMSALGAFGAIDYAKRKNVMARQAQYELAQGSDLYQAAKDAGVGEWLLGRGPQWEKENVPNGGFLAENPVVGQFFDPTQKLRDAFFSVAILADKDTRGKYMPTLKQYWQGSGMAYTMVSDAAKRQEFIDRVNAGDDPGLVAQELGNVWTELGGSFFNDPTTYLGVSIYGRGATALRIPFTSKPIMVAGKALRVPWQKVGQIPTFGELIGVGLRATRTKQALQVASAIPAAADEVLRMEKVAESVGGWGKLADEADAFGKVKQMGANLLETVRQWDANLIAGKLPNARTMTTSSVKASQFYRNAHDALGLVIGGGGTIDDRLESLNTLRQMHLGDDVTRAEAVAMAVKEHGQLAMSDGFLQLGKFLATFEGDEDIARLLLKTGENPAEILAKLAPKLDNFAKQFYPSMDEMAAAAGKLTEKGDELKKATGVIEDLQSRVDALRAAQPELLAPDLASTKKVVKSRDLVAAEKELTKAQKAFDSAFGREQELAKAYEQINPLMRKGRDTLKVYEKTFFRPAKRYMDTVFLAIRPAQYMKQLQSQTALIAMDLGFLDAIEIGARTALTSFSDGWTAKMIKANSDEITKILGFAPEAMSRGVTAAGEAKGAGFLRVSGNLDSLMSSEIVLRTARREMSKVLSNSHGMLDFKKLETVFSKDELGVLNRLIAETGSEKEALSQFAKLAKKGSVEAWRMLPMPDNMKDFLQQSKTYEEFIKLQKTARTRDEFMTGVDDLITRMTKQAQRAAAADPPVVDEQTNQVIREAFLEAQELANKGLMNEAETKVFNNMVNAYEYMRRDLEMGAKEFRNAVDVLAGQTGVIANPEYRSAIQSLDEATGMIHDLYPKYDETAKLVREVLHENKSLPSLERAQMLDNSRFDIPTYTGYTLEELGKLPPKDFEKATWSAYFAWGRDYWKQANTEVLARTVESLDAIAETAGTTVDDVIARSSTVREYLYNARRYQQQAVMWENNTRYVSNNLAQIANAYGIPTASAKGAPISKNLLKILNDNLPEGIEPFKDYTDAQARIDEARVALSQWSNVKNPGEAAGKVDEFLGKVTPPPATATKATTTTPKAAEATKLPNIVEKAKSTPRSELPDDISQRIADGAKQLMDELNSGTGKTVQQPRQGTEAFSVTATPTTNIEWYQDMPKKLQNKPALNKALEKIIIDKGADTGVNVERMKEMIIDRLRFGDKLTGTPPDLPALKALGADDKTLRAALDDYNDITRQSKTLDEVLGLADEGTGLEAPRRVGDAYFDEAGNLITPDINELPPVVHAGTATGAQAMHGNLTDPKFATDIKAWSDSVTEKWGSLQELPQLDATKRAALTEWGREATKRMNFIRAKINKVATMQRDDLLLSYDKNYGDLALGYLKPYHYWQTRQYVKTAARFVDHPSWANGYMQYKDAMAKENADLPEWYRYNIQINNIFGMQLQNPMFLNLESALNPIYDLTGTDFNDPYKRVDWLSRTVDDLGKTGGTFMPPIQWLVGLNLYRKGENDAAQRWMGRVLGPTGQAIKAGLTSAGMDINIGNFIQHNEVDPFVNFLMGGLDPNERKRVGRQISGMIEDGLSAEEALEAMFNQKGELYDEAVRQSVLARSPAEMKSFFLGVNMKPRSMKDAEIETFYQEYYQLRAQADFMPPEDYRQAWDLLRDKYSFMDTVLLSGKNTPDRESAYAYNVFGRVPPGQTRDLYEAAGIDPDLVQMFYDTKGEMPEMSPSDKARFMAGVADLGAMLKIPEYTTKQDWNNARTGYKAIQGEMTMWFGKDISEQIDYYYSLDDKGKTAYDAINPKVQLALDWQNQQIISNPDIYQFYGGLGSLERFHKGKAYDQLDQEFGEEIQKTWDTYYEMQMYDPKGAGKFKKAHPELNTYSQRKKVLMDAALRNIVNFAAVLPEADIPPQLTGREPVSVGQTNIANYANQPPAPTFEQWTQELPIETQLIAQYWNGDIKLPSAVVSSLDFKAREYGYASGDDLLQAILISMQQGQPMQMAAQP